MSIFVKGERATTKNAVQKLVIEKSLTRFYNIFPV